MATTTTNFGWDIPQSTDLVKDGATAIAALGQDIDTALIDLKGGTTGQILTKASGTNLDFSWGAAPSGGAFILTGSADFTTSSAVNINNCFSATYLNYFVKVNLTAVSASDGEIQFRMRVGGTDDTSSNYIDQRILQRSTTLVGATQTAVTQRLGDMASSHIGKTAYELQVCDPFIAKPTTYIYNCNVWNGSGDNSQHRGTGCHNVSTSYDGISIYPNTGTFSGKIRVYGYTLS
jgi:hypothetical protein